MDLSRVVLNRSRVRLESSSPEVVGSADLNVEMPIATSRKEAALTRIVKELSVFYEDPIENITVSPVDGDLFHLRATITGPLDTPYEGGVFVLILKLPEWYPFVPPKVKFLTKIYHPNVNEQGSIGLDILRDQWYPSLSIPKLLLSISSFLADPNPDDPYDSDIGNAYKNDRERYNQTVREWTERYAMGHLNNIECILTSGEEELGPINVLKQPKSEPIVSSSSNDGQLATRPKKRKRQHGGDQIGHSIIEHLMKEKKMDPLSLMVDQTMAKLVNKSLDAKVLAFRRAINNVIDKFEEEMLQSI